MVADAFIVRAGMKESLFKLGVDPGRFPHLEDVVDE